MSDNELGWYLRTRREAVKPADVGLPEGFRRRTPGLRRSELAALAGVSVEYLTRLEQGRDRNPSIQVLAALGDALRLPSEQRLHLRRLAKLISGDAVHCRAAEPPDRSVRPTVLALLEQMEPAPAILVNRLGDVLASTRGYQRLVEPLGLLETRPPNLVRFVFTDPRARAVYPDWDRVADDQAVHVRMGMAVADPHVMEFAEELTITAGRPFTDRLAGPFDPARSAGIDRLVHPEVGALRLAWETLELPDTDGRLVAYLPADDVTASALDHLAARAPRALRIVGD